MKAFIAVENNAGIDSKIDNRFARADCFMVYDMESDKILSIEENRFKNGAHGVGIETGNYVIKSGCKLAIGPNPGPKAESVLRAGNIEFYIAENCTAKEAIERYRAKA